MFKNQIIKIFLTLSPMFVLSGCFSPKAKEINLEIPLPPMPKDEVIKEIVIEDSFNFLENAKVVQGDYSFGKKDPFNLSEESESALSKKDYILKAIISDQSNNYALISFRGNIFQLKEGDIGGISNKFIPNGIKVKAVDIKQQIVLLSSKDSELKLSMNDDD